MTKHAPDFKDGSVLPEEYQALLNRLAAVLGERFAEEDYKAQSNQDEDRRSAQTE